MPPLCNAVSIPCAEHCLLAYLRTLLAISAVLDGFLCITALRFYSYLVLWFAMLCSVYAMKMELYVHVRVDSFGRILIASKAAAQEYI